MNCFLGIKEGQWVKGGEIKRAIYSGNGRYFPIIFSIIYSTMIHLIPKYNLNIITPLILLVFVT